MKKILKNINSSWHFAFVLNMVKKANGPLPPPFTWTYSNLRPRRFAAGKNKKAIMTFGLLSFMILTPTYFRQFEPTDNDETQVTFQPSLCITALS